MSTPKHSLEDATLPDAKQTRSYTDRDLINHPFAKIADATELVIRTTKCRMKIPIQPIFDLRHLRILVLRIDETFDWGCGLERLTNLTKLEIKSWDMRAVEPIDLTGLTSLTSLSLSSVCDSSDFNWNAIGASLAGLVNLDFLALKNWAVPAVTSFQSFTRLRELRLSASGADLRKGDVDNINSLTTLEILSIVGVDGFPNGFVLEPAMSRLIELDLRDTDFHQFPDAIMYMTRLRRLTLYDCGITLFPWEIGMLTSLECFDSLESQSTQWPLSATNLPCRTGTIFAETKSLLLKEKKLRGYTDDSTWKHLCTVDMPALLERESRDPSSLVSLIPRDIVGLIDPMLRMERPFVMIRPARPWYY